MRTLIDRCENFAAAVAEAKAGRRIGYVSYRAIAKKYNVNPDTLRRNADDEYRERRNAFYRIKQAAPRPSIAVQTTFESITKMVVDRVSLGGPSHVPVSLPRVRFLEGSDGR